MPVRGLDCNTWKRVRSLSGCTINIKSRTLIGWSDLNNQSNVGVFEITKLAAKFLRVSTSHKQLQNREYVSNHVPRAAENVVHI